ncbi:hypothetical protein K469DRAFT_732914 [Zopfia rhizophila CBS 207.26]|uniref:Phosphate transporter n=1 Tax=Zopfia rhizophila CBS 207.26 TaxID=1314779 RepID=A0A6A6ELG5_9PEZI|nr:hypothetical protein K469DRAFT_732914 [Zopfia rhizophila CBS 207.26]
MSISYRQAMIFGTIFEMLGAITVGARMADTIKNGIIPISAVAGVGVATVEASQVQWGWNNGKGLGAIFAGLGVAPAIPAGFAATIFMLIKLVVHIRKNLVPWAVNTSPFFFLIAGTICTLSIIYKGSSNLGLHKKPAYKECCYLRVWHSVTTGGGVAVLSAIFFVPFVHAKVIKKDYTVKWRMFILGRLLFKRPAPADADWANVLNYAVVQEEQEDQSSTSSPESVGEYDVSGTETGDVPITTPAEENEKKLAAAEVTQSTYKELVAQGEIKLHAKLVKKRGPLGWAMRTLRGNPMGAGQLYELHHIKILAKRIPAMIVCGALYGLHYDIHAAQTGIAGTPEGERMQRVYAHAEKYPNEVEHTYYAAASKPPVPVTGNKITYHSPSRGCSMEMGAAITVLVFSQFYLPVSTSMYITGATVGGGLCKGILKAVNFQRVGELMGLFLNATPFF